jgi:hypothetical protein
MMPEIAQLTSLPVTVPMGGVAVVLVDGAVAPSGIQGPGQLKADPWRKHLPGGVQVQAILFPSRKLTLHLDMTDLRSAEDVRLDLNLTLRLHIENPVLFITDFMPEARPITTDALSHYLAQALHPRLLPPFRQRTLDALEQERAALYIVPAHDRSSWERFEARDTCCAGGPR